MVSAVTSRRRVPTYCLLLLLLLIRIRRYTNTVAEAFAKWINFTFLRKYDNIIVLCTYYYYFEPIPLGIPNPPPRPPPNRVVRNIRLPPRRPASAHYPRHRRVRSVPSVRARSLSLSLSLGRRELADPLYRHRGVVFYFILFYIFFQIF